MQILDGKKIKQEKIEELKKEISTLKRKPGLAVIQVGDNPASNVYVSNKEKTGLELGCNFEYIKFPEDVQEDLILATIDRLNDDMSIDGIIVQLPLPEHLNKEKIQNRVCHKKDVDGLTDINAGLLMHNKDCLVPCTPNGILEILKYYDISVSGKNVVIVGRSELVGRPMFSLMLNNNATVTICHSYTSNLKDITKTADILIVAVGKKHMITSSMVKEGAVVIDVGINRVDGKIYGDVNYEEVKDICSYITPVPGGVGQMTVLSIYQNLLKAYKNNNLDM
ncbi:MAG: bifunctional 5,10-methylenetetrahydrofolate dehydrogenase/5,10-methenyltetrahydrofolate cyclohydrolase [Bacilli bacterium]|nr:bifunctional 5,10-methylenetetrahydrofolate dehydrogenase/5,10-methenyltetrahydrofolate cyclohydrolase [Bacilli bacterium]